MGHYAYELGKQAGKLVARSTTVKMNKPGAKKKSRDALNASGHRNSDGPWQKGRKVKK